jgi:shikimate kinase
MRHVVMVGLMGSGKTTVGSRVAATLGWPVSDSDAAIEAAMGRTGRELRDSAGTDALHELERRHLLDGLASPDPAVICPAASVVDDAACREALRDPGVLVAWLRVPAALAAGRFEAQAHRPRYGDDPAEFLAAQAARRDRLFLEVADLVLAADEASPDELARRVVERLRGA